MLSVFSVKLTLCQVSCLLQCRHFFFVINSVLCDQVIATFHNLQPISDMIRRGSINTLKLIIFL